MLYNVVIDKTVAKDRDKLVEHLYLFLNRYIPSRLIYETNENQEDCTQDTIMFILKRYDDLVVDLEKEDKDWRDKFNYEKYFYNRARSFISTWLKRKNREKRLEQEYIDNAIYLKKYQSEFDYNPIDYTTLERITKEYNFTNNKLLKLNKITEAMLEGIGYSSTDKYDIDISEDTHINNILTKIAYVVVDEYLIEVAGIR